MSKVPVAPVPIELMPSDRSSLGTEFIYDYGYLKYGLSGHIAVTLDADGWPSTELECRPRRSLTPLQSEAKSSTLPPIIPDGLLRGFRLGDASYPARLRDVVGQVIEALSIRQRVRDSKGMVAILEQSFKDPGTAALLDAVLRRSASARQVLDFKGYINEINEMSPSRPVERVHLQSVLGKRQHRHRKSRKLSSAHDNSEEDLLDVSPLDADTIRQSVFNYGRGEELTILPNNEPAEPRQSEPRKKQKRGCRGRSRQNHQGSQYKQPIAAPSAQDPETQVQAEAMDNQSQLTSANHVLHANPGEIDARTAISNRPTERRRRKKTRNRMFTGANGPVFSPNLVLYPLPRRAPGTRARRLGPTNHFYY